MTKKQAPSKLKRGLTTGSCATAATRAAFIGYITGNVPTSVWITLPNKQKVRFKVIGGKKYRNWCEASVTKDAGDDPDVTHGATIISRVWESADAKTSRLYSDNAEASAPIHFIAGDGVGTVTKEGLMVDVGEPAINPVPRVMVAQTVSEVATEFDHQFSSQTLCVRISIPHGKKIARSTWNNRLGIVGGLSILGTTGIVIPYSCSAWIHSIHRGMDVAEKAKSEMISASVGATSEAMIVRELGLDITSRIDMGDFILGTLKYLRKKSIPKFIIAGGVGKITKLAQGATDLHSARSQVNKDELFTLAKTTFASIENGEQLASLCFSTNTVNHLVTELQKLDKNASSLFCQQISERALLNARKMLGAKCGNQLGVWICNRKGKFLAKSQEWDS